MLWNEGEAAEVVYTLLGPVMFRYFQVQPALLDRRAGGVCGAMALIYTRLAGQARVVISVCTYMYMLRTDQVFA